MDFIETVAAPDRSRRVFLLSIDLEDVRTMIAGGERYVDRVPANTRRYLEMFARHGARCTFFTVGNVARRHPDLIRTILDAGHEIGCHGSEHTTLDLHDARSLELDLERCLEDFRCAGAEHVIGFRAPCGSMIASTVWAYEILLKMGFRYSTSVLSVRNPLFGWPEFPDVPVRLRNGLWEIPMSLVGPPFLKMPFAGGTYFRVVPYAIKRLLVRNVIGRGRPLVGYFHPYDIDDEQERFRHPLLEERPLLNALMFVGRKSLLRQLERLLTEERLDVVRYDDYVDSLAASTP